MKTLNILNDFELKQIFGPLEDILPLHEGKRTDRRERKRKRTECYQLYVVVKTWTIYSVLLSGGLNFHYDYQ